MWRSTATPFVAYRPCGTTDRLSGQGRTRRPHALSYLESSRSRQARQAVCLGGSELRRSVREPPKGPGGCKVSSVGYRPASKSIGRTPREEPKRLWLCPLPVSAFTRVFDALWGEGNSNRAATRMGEGLRSVGRPQPLTHFECIALSALPSPFGRGRSNERRRSLTSKISASAR
jgi:hypothetical protein